jgi:hypothetical protein
MGLTTTPAKNAHHDTINYAWYLRSNGVLNIKENGADK